MKIKNGVLFLFCLVLYCCSNVSDKIDSSEKDDKKVIIAYVHGLQDNWGEEDEKANLITHINFAFANIKEGKVVFGKPQDTSSIARLNDLKRTNLSLKILISIGGWSWSGGFSDAALTPESRELFAQSAVDFIVDNKIDGIDLDWEYPGLVGAGNTFRPEDGENYNSLLKLIREKLDALGSETKQRYLLTIATGASQNYLEKHNLKEAEKYLDFINIMTYDYLTGGSNIAGHHANLYPSNTNTNQYGNSSDVAVQQHLAAGVPAQKLVLGVPFYGRYWMGVNPNNKGLYERSSGKRGSLSFHQIQDSLDKGDVFEYIWDDVGKVPYLWRDRDSTFVTYDDPKSLKLKSQYIKEKELGGVMFWQFNGDNGMLLDALNEEL